MAHETAILIIILLIPWLRTPKHVQERIQEGRTGKGLFMQLGSFQRRIISLSPHSAIGWFHISNALYSTLFINANPFQQINRINLNPSPNAFDNDILTIAFVCNTFYIYINTGSGFTPKEVFVWVSFLNYIRYSNFILYI